MAEIERVKHPEDTEAAELPAWMTGGDADYARPLPSEGRRVRGWWDLPIAESMWRADARQVER